MLAAACRTRLRADFAERYTVAFASRRAWRAAASPPPAPAHLSHPRTCAPIAPCPHAVPAIRRRRDREDCRRSSTRSSGGPRKDSRKGNEAAREGAQVGRLQAARSGKSDADAGAGAANAELEMAELRRQFPVPPVPPVPPSDPREKAREDERAKQPRRRVPEGWVESTEPFSRSFKVGRDATLLLTNVAGNIQVSPGGERPDRGRKR